MGATGTGKTATTAWLIEKLQRPTLIIEPNKTLAAQLCAEFRELMPDNAVSYFVSYYDYYQPEAYIPQTDTYIEKDSNINDDVERLRHQATANLLTRRDCVVVATVSCIYGLGTPEEYAGRMLFLKVGQEINRDDLLRQFVAMQYKRNDIAFTRGTFRVRGDTVEIIPVYEELAVRIEFFGDEIDRISTLHPLTGDEIDEENEVHIFPASHYVAGPERMERALKTIREELEERLAELRKQGKELEAQRLNMRTTYDLEMLTQVGVCSGVENYSRHFDGRAAGTPPHTLLDFFPDDFLLVIDESHVTVPQIVARVLERVVAVAVGRILGVENLHHAVVPHEVRQHPLHGRPLRVARDARRVGGPPEPQERGDEQIERLARAWRAEAHHVAVDLHEALPARPYRIGVEAELDRKSVV